MYTHQLRVRYAETDKMGLAHHSSYWLWFEETRVEFFNDNNIDYTEIEEAGFALPVSESYCKYMTPAYFNEVLNVQCWISKIGSASIKIEYKIIKNNNITVARAYTVHPVVNKNGKIVKIPEILEKVFMKIADSEHKEDI